MSNKTLTELTKTNIEEMKKKYPLLYDVSYEAEDDRFIAWLKFPYWSTDSNGGFFTFYTVEEFERLLTESVRRYTDEEIAAGKYQAEQYV